MASSFTATQTIDQNFLVEPLGGSKNPASYLDHLPDEVYNKAFDSHLVRFIYALLGPAGVGNLRTQFAQARLLFEAHDLDLYDLDRFYGNPLQFGRITDETYTADITGLLPQEEWEEIRAKDAKYRNRIIDFLAGARAGCTPLGMRLVARSGLGHEVEIIENYKAMFDANTDDPLDLVEQGQTRLLNEMIILPRQEVTQSEVQMLTITGSPTGGTFRFVVLNPALTSTDIAWNSSRQEIQIALIDMLGVSPSSISVTGGPLPDNPISIRFTGDLEGQNVPQLQVDNTLLDDAQIAITTQVQGFDGSTEVVDIAPINQKHMQEAIDRIRPLTVIPTTGVASGNRSRIDWITAAASSEFDEMTRFVTGSGAMVWPPLDNVHWIEAGKEHKAPRPSGSLPYQYSIFHKVSKTLSYDSSAVVRPEYLTENWVTIQNKVSSTHIGTFDPHHVLVYPFLRLATSGQVFSPDEAIAPPNDQMTIDQIIDTPSGPVGLIQGIYPSDYLGLPGAPKLLATSPLYFWSSIEKITGTEYLEIDLGAPRAINSISFEATKKPFAITLSYDLLDQGNQRSWQDVTPALGSSATTVVSDPVALNPWLPLQYRVTNPKGEMIYSRYIRVKFDRQAPADFISFDGVRYPWSIDVRNLRIGRVVTNQ